MVSGARNPRDQKATAGELQVFFSIYLALVEGPKSTVFCTALYSSAWATECKIIPPPNSRHDNKDGRKDARWVIC